MLNDDRENRLKFLSWENKKETTKSFDEPFISQIYASRDKTLLATEGKKGVRIIEAATGKTIAILPFAPDKRGPLIFTPDNNHLIGGKQGEATAVLWDIKEAKPLEEFRSPWPTYGFALSPKGNMLATFGFTRVVEFFDVKTGTLLDKEVVTTGGILFLAFSPDGTTYVTGDTDGRIRLFHTPKRKEEK